MKSIFETEKREEQSICVCVVLVMFCVYFAGPLYLFMAAQTFPNRLTPTALPTMAAEESQQSSTHSSPHHGQVQLPPLKKKKKKKREHKPKITPREEI